MLELRNLIDGDHIGADSSNTLDVFEPATGTAYATAPNSAEADVNRAVDAAHIAFPAWASAGAQARSDAMLRLAALIERDTEAFAQAESKDSGKPLSLARLVDIPRAVSNLRFFATAVLHGSGEMHQGESGSLHYTLRKPRGVAACISPWNLPLYLFTWKIAPALATGNTVVGKPSELTPVTAWMLGERSREAGFPPGVLNIIHGLGTNAGAPLVAHPQTPTVTFTGGTKTGAAIAQAAAPKMKRLALELGGKNPNIVFADADLDAAVETAARAAFTNQGQVCLCGSRVYVERSAYDVFAERFVERVSALQVGDPLDPASDLGALVSKDHHGRVSDAIERATHEGGEILTGGAPPRMLHGRCANGWFLQPTVIAGLGPNTATQREEIFGPVVSIAPFEDEDHALTMANGVDYGLASMVWTRDLARAHRVAAKLEAGIVWINSWMVRDLRTPFGGMKMSGLGREGGQHAIKFFTEPSTVCIPGG